jgi:signal transduction histidine kinase
MDIYSRKTRWKIYLAGAGILILFMTLMYTNYLARNVAEQERQSMDIWVKAYETQLQYSDSLNYDISFQMQIIQGNKYIPVIVTDEAGNILDAINFPKLDDRTYLDKQLQKIIRSGRQPIKMEFLGEVSYLYYKNSMILDRLKYYPFIQVTLIAAFIFLGYIGFSSARKAEQNRVWVGMAKETAHQLGTPISAIIAWLEHLKLMSDDSPEKQELISELTKDVERLELVADRFSKIGSAPELKEANIYEELEKVRQYMSKRTPRKVVFRFPPTGSTLLMVKINPHLFEWVLENLIRNALDALDGEGQITAEVYEDSKYVNIDISDTGKGIPSGTFKRVFQPGYTTKKRGWGLGLSLSKRIIENYHSGKIFVKKSEVNVGTTFTIRLPK